MTNKQSESDVTGEATPCPTCECDGTIEGRKGRELIAQRDALVKALKFCHDLADEELEYARVGTGAEVALRHIARRAKESLALVKGEKKDE
jgi:hypothetical protein